MIEETTCETCGGRLIKSFGGWTHCPAPTRRHIARPRKDRS